MEREFMPLGVMHHRPGPGEREMSMEEFKKWLKKYDTDGDGRISVEELREAIRSHEGWFSKAKAKHVMDSVDTNSNGFIDLHENEISKLVVFAMKQFGLKVVAS